MASKPDKCVFILRVNRGAVCLAVKDSRIYQRTDVLPYTKTDLHRSTFGNRRLGYVTKTLKTRRFNQVTNIGTP